MTSPPDKTVYKILAQTDWDEAIRTGRYTGSADDERDGFIHLSTAAQLAGTAARHFKGKVGLVLVALDAAQLGAGLKWEPSRGGDLFPHLYGVLDPALALSVAPMPLGPDATPLIPPEVEA